MKKSLYEFMQASRCWFGKLAAALKSYGFTQPYSYYSLFTYARKHVQLNVLIYVDDMIILGNGQQALLNFKTYLGKYFKIKDLGVLKYFLRPEVARGPHEIFMCQRKYALDIISECELLGAKPANFSMEQHHQLALVDGPLMDDAAQYRRLMRQLIYLAITRPNLTYSVHILSQFMQAPHVAHWEATL